MKHKLSTLEYYTKYEGFEIPKCNCGRECVYKSGLRFKRHCDNAKCELTSKRTVRKAVVISDETKRKLREKRLAWLKANPEKTAWRLGNKQSWPEKFFEEACKRVNLDKKFQIIREFSVYPFFVDFAFPQIKVAAEVDGAQHELEYRKAKDEEKDALLKSNGWRIYRIPAHLLYSKEDADTVVKHLVEFIGSAEVFDQVGFVTAKALKEQRLEVQKLEKEQQFLDKIAKMKTLDFSVQGWPKQAVDILGVQAHSVRKWMARNMSDFYEANKFKMKGTKK